MKFQSPPHTKNAEGKPRKTGFEFELAGLETKACAELVAELFDGEIEYIHSLEAEITDTPMGNFKVEMDAHMVKNLAAKLEKKHPVNKDDLIDANKLRAQLSEWMGDVAGEVVPLEIVTPPFNFEQFPQLEGLRHKLQQRKAEGSKAFFTNAFGMHINPDIASEDVAYIRDVLRAFLVLYPWLKEAMEVDISRRLLTYIDPFPKAYVKLVLDENYAPSLDAFIEDYLEHNPTRNRALDLWPLFSHLKPESVKGLDKDDRKLVKARPTFHYRLPNCEIDNPDWRIARDWNYWVEVERLADDKEKLSAMAEDYLTSLNKAITWFDPSWAKQTAEQYGYSG